MCAINAAFRLLGMQLVIINVYNRSSSTPKTGNGRSNGHTPRSVPPRRNFRSERQEPAVGEVENSEVSDEVTSANSSKHVYIKIGDSCLKARYTLEQRGECNCLCHASSIMLGFCQL